MDLHNMIKIKKKSSLTLFCFFLIKATQHESIRIPTNIRQFILVSTNAHSKKVPKILTQII